MGGGCRGRRGRGDRGLGLCGPGRGACWDASLRGGRSGRRCGLGLCGCGGFVLGGPCLGFVVVGRFLFCVAFWELV